MSNPRARLLLSACLLTTAPAFAQEPAAPEFRKTVDLPLQLPGLLLDDALGVASAPWRWGTEDWSRLALGSAAVVGTALLLDRPVRKAIQRHDGPTLARWSNNLEPLGSTYSILAAGGFYAYGWLAKDAEARATGADALSAMAISCVVLIPVKYAVGRARPDENLGPNSFKPLGSRASFPSRHTTVAFTAAAVLTEHYAETWVQVAAYGLATAAGLARMGQDVHWTSDAVAGALIGTAVGKLVTRMNQRMRFGKQAGFRLVVEPELGLGYQGVRMGLTF